MDAAHIATDKEIARIQKRLHLIYSQAEKQVNGELKKWAKSIQKKADTLLQAISDAKNENELRETRNAYKQFFLRAVMKDAKFIKASQNAAGIIYQANVDASRRINSKVANSYSENYNYIGIKLQRNLDGYKFKPVTENDAERYGKIARQTVDEKKDRRWNERNIAAAVVSGALLLWGIDKIVNHASTLTTKKNEDGANRQATDIISDAESKGRLDSMYRAHDEGFDGVKKQWICVFDNRTRDTHIEYNDLGPVELEYEYNAGLKRPKDSNCRDLSDVCNCRCAITTHFGYAKGTTRAARRGDVAGSYKKPRSFKGTETEYVSQMSYKDWMKWRSR